MTQVSPWIQFLKVETPASVVVHHEDGLLTRPNAKICSRGKRLKSGAHLRPRCTGRPLEDAVEIAIPAEPSSETQAAATIESLRIQGACCDVAPQTGHAAVQTLAAHPPPGSCGRSRWGAEVRADSAARLNRISLRTVMHNSDRRMNQTILDRFRSGRELADGQIQIAVNHAFLGRPVVTRRRTLVKKISERASENRTWEANPRLPTARSAHPERASGHWLLQ